MNTKFYDKYLKYKNKYLNLKYDLRPNNDILSTSSSGNRTNILQIDDNTIVYSVKHYLDKSTNSFYLYAPQT